MIPAYDGPPNAEVLIVGEAWGYHEANWKPHPKPFVGPSGKLLDEMIAFAGYSRARCRVTNVAHGQPPSNKIENWLTDSPTKAEKLGLTHEHRGMFCNDIVWEGVQELYREIERLKPKLIIGCGNTPLWALTGERGITSWRGSELHYEADYGRTDIPFIPVLHPAYILRAWGEKAITIHDLRVRAFGKLGNPSLREPPPWNFHIDPQTRDGLNAMLAPLQARLNEGPTWVAVDVETRRGPPRTVCIGFGWSELDACCVPLEHADGSSYWGDDTAQVHDAIRWVLTHSNTQIIGQNFNYDAQYCELDFGVKVYASYDTGIAQHLMFPGTQKDLARLASMYCKWYEYWKDDLKDWASDLDELRMWRYNCIDNVRTFEVAMAQMPTLKKLGFVRA